MIKEYCITVVKNITEEEKEVFMSIDLTQISTLRISGDDDSNCVIDMRNGESYTLHEEYEQVLKDWCDARAIVPIRVATIGN